MWQTTCKTLKIYLIKSHLCFVTLMVRKNEQTDFNIVIGNRAEFVLLFSFVWNGYSCTILFQFLEVLKDPYTRIHLFEFKCVDFVLKFLLHCRYDAVSFFPSKSGNLNHIHILLQSLWYIQCSCINWCGILYLHFCIDCRYI